jgi:hypothetical protein
MLTANSARTASTAAYPGTSPFSTLEPTLPQADRYALVATRSVCQSGSFRADREITQQLFDSAAGGFGACGFTYPAASRRVVESSMNCCSTANPRPVLNAPLHRVSPTHPLV